MSDSDLIKFAEPVEKHFQLTIIAKHKSGRGIRVDCLCDCGKTVSLKYSVILNGHYMSCGCGQKENRTSIGRRTRTHGYTRTPIYNIHQHILARCYRETSNDYPDYGGRGITVCERWRGKDGFTNFLADMGEPPDGASIDRKENNGNYCPENCRWATAKEQGRNQRTNRMITHNGKTQCLAAWCEELSLVYNKIEMRLRRGCPIEKLFDPGDGRTTNGRKRPK